MLCMFCSICFWVPFPVLLWILCLPYLHFLQPKKNDLPFRRHARYLALSNIIAIAAVGLISAAVQREWIELLPIAGALFQTGGLWCNNEQTIRKFGLCGAPFWLVYNYISQAYGASLGSMIAIISIIISMIRYRKKG